MIASEGASLQPKPVLCIPGGVRRMGDEPDACCLCDKETIFRFHPVGMNDELWVCPECFESLHRPEEPWWLPVLRWFVGRKR